ncbi:hypothetical protein KUM39_19055 [Streptomyces sp. J2-1]|uniref:hypothetical protein n=1 Tax=Streptomyces corallincola TaxID=2851888 RepID=UPI001C3942BF|nr:hypothetical protein [Streptomyces corallincola]MBV2356451.1 hypothetical protein [Streptomyces corallincola]
MPVNGNNVQLDYKAVDEVSKQLNGAVDDVVPRLEVLRNSVDGLLSSGLFLQQTSPAMQHAYSQFTVQLTQVVNKINDFAKQFMDIKQQIADMDATLSTQINESGG